MCDLLVDDNMLIKVKDNVDEENLIVEFKIKLPMLPFEVVHLLAGSVAGTVGAIATCPLEVVKTRLQSSVTHFHPAYIQSHTTTYVPRTVVPNVHLYTSAGSITADSHIIQNGYHHQKRHVSLLQCLRYIVQTEGINGLFKGLGPNLVGVAPSR